MPANTPAREPRALPPETRAAAARARSVKLVDPRFCHHTGNRTSGERKGGVYYAGSNVSSNKVNRNRLRTRP